MAVEPENRIAIESDSDVVTARQRARELAAGLDLTSTDQTLLATAISEVARNITTYAPARRGAAVDRARQRRPRGHPRGRARRRPRDRGHRAGDAGRLHLGRRARARAARARAGWSTSSTSRAPPARGPRSRWSSGRGCARRGVAGDARAGRGRRGDRGRGAVGRPRRVRRLRRRRAGGGRRRARARRRRRPTRPRSPPRRSGAIAASPPESLLRRCHAALRKTRGAVMTLAWFDLERRRLAWAGVGNVEARLVRGAAVYGDRHDSALVLGGVVGYNLPQRAHVAPWRWRPATRSRSPRTGSRATTRPRWRPGSPPSAWPS